MSITLTPPTLRRHGQHILAALCMVGAAGCQPMSVTTPGAVVAPPSEEQRSVMVDSVNYMHERSTMYTLYDLSKTPPAAIGGAIVDRLATGGEKGCCLGLPLQWRPGLKLRLKWHESDRERVYEDHTRDFEVPHYDAPADLYVVFHHGEEVELVVSEAEPGHPDWRGRLKKTPWEQCLSENERKVCKAALPKQFDTASYQGYCAEAIAEKLPNAEDHCEFLMQSCTRDYEDDQFCKNLLWETRSK